MERTCAAAEYVCVLLFLTCPGSYRHRLVRELHSSTHFFVFESGLGGFGCGVLKNGMCRWHHVLLAVPDSATSCAGQERVSQRKLWQAAQTSFLRYQGQCQQIERAQLGVVVADDEPRLVSLCIGGILGFLIQFVLIWNGCECCQALMGDCWRKTF